MAPCRRHCSGRSRCGRLASSWDVSTFLLNGKDGRRKSLPEAPKQRNVAAFEALAAHRADNVHGHRRLADEAPHLKVAKLAAHVCAAALQLALPSGEPCLARRPELLRATSKAAKRRAERGAQRLGRDLPAFAAPKVPPGSWHSPSSRQLRIHKKRGGRRRDGGVAPCCCDAAAHGGAAARAKSSSQRRSDVFSDSPVAGAMNVMLALLTLGMLGILVIRSILLTVGILVIGSIWDMGITML